MTLLTTVVTLFYGFFALICFIVLLGVLREQMVDGDEEGFAAGHLVSRIAAWAFIVGFATVGAVCWPMVLIGCYLKSLD